MSEVTTVTWPQCLQRGIFALSPLKRRVVALFQIIRCGPKKFWIVAEPGQGGVYPSVQNTANVTVLMGVIDGLSPRRVERSAGYLAPLHRQHLLHGIYGDLVLGGSLPGPNLFAIRCVFVARPQVLRVAVRAVSNPSLGELVFCRVIVVGVGATLFRILVWHRGSPSCVDVPEACQNPPRRSRWATVPCGALRGGRTSSSGDRRRRRA